MADRDQRAFERGLFSRSQNGAEFFSQGRVMPFAKGGVVSSGPTMFPMRGGRGLMGEAGPEAIMPLARGADGRLGVQTAGGGRPVNVTVNVSTPDVKGFERSQSQIAAQMARALGARRAATGEERRMAFHEVRFPANLSFGSVGGPERRTEVVALTNGFEERNTPWAEARRRYDAGVSLRSSRRYRGSDRLFRGASGAAACLSLEGLGGLQELQVVCDHRVRGSADRVEGDGVGTTFQLVKTYASGPHAQVRRIVKPVAGTVRVGLAG